MNGRDMSVRITAHGVSVIAVAEGVSWSGEVMRDLMSRANDGLERALAIASQYVDIDDEDLDVEVETEDTADGE